MHRGVIRSLCTQGVEAHEQIQQRKDRFEKWLSDHKRRIEDAQVLFSSSCGTILSLSLSLYP